MNLKPGKISVKQKRNIEEIFTEEIRILERWKNNFRDLLPLVNNSDGEEEIKGADSGVRNKGTYRE